MNIWQKALGALAVAGFLGVGVLACRRPVTAGAISADGYRHGTYPYGVIHQMGENLLPPVWVLDNYYLDESGLKRERYAAQRVQFPQGGSTARRAPSPPPLSQSADADASV